MTPEPAVPYGDPVTGVRAPELTVKAETSLEPELAEYSRAPVESTATATGCVPAANEDPALSPPEEAMPKDTTALCAESAAYRNCPFASMVIPAMLAPVGAGKGEPVISARAPLEAMEKTEIVPAVPFARYKKPAVGETTMKCAVAGAGKGDPEISVNNPLVASMLNTEMLADP